MSPPQAASTDVKTQLPTAAVSPGETRSSSSSRKVTFDKPIFAAGKAASPSGKAASPARKASAAGAGGECPTLSTYNQLFSPGPDRQDSWTIEAQRSDRVMANATPGSGSASMPGEGSPSSSLLGGASGYTPASASYLESARKVDDLRGRLESLEVALREMESKAVAHLDRSLHDRVLATAAKIVQKRFLADKELDRRLQHSILQTAIKVVNKRQAAAAPAAAGGQGVAQRDAAGPGEAADPTRKLEFEQPGEPGSAGAGGEDQVQAYVAHIEQGLGEVVRRLEKKVEGVASLLDQGVLELLEARLSSGLVKLETRLAAVEEPAQRPGAEDAAQRLLERVAGMEAAMAEQSRAVSDLLAALGTQGTAAAERAAAAVAAVQAAAEAGAAAGDKAAEKAGDDEAPMAAAAEAVPQQSADPPAKPAAQGPAARAEGTREAAPPATQLVQRRAAAARRSMLGDPVRAAASAGRPVTPRIKPTHTAGTAQQIAIATARQQLAKQAARAREEAEAESPGWVSALYVFGWILLGLLGAAALLMGGVATLIKSGRLSEADLAFLWEAPGGR